jgi:hypothetical protein
MATAPPDGAALMAAAPAAAPPTAPAPLLPPADTADLAAASAPAAQAPPAPPVTFARGLGPTGADGRPATHHTVAPGASAAGPLTKNCLSRLSPGLLLALVVLATLVVAMVVAQLCGGKKGSGFRGERLTSLCGGAGRLPLSRSERDHYAPAGPDSWRPPMYPAGPARGFPQGETERAGAAILAGSP